jgi:hypothetical protein
LATSGEWWVLFRFSFLSPIKIQSPHQIWQEKVSVIMMLCQLKEQNKTKADLYWPYEPEQTVSLPSLPSFLASNSPLYFQLNRPTELQIENRGVTEDDVKQMRTTKLIVKGRSSRTGEIRYVDFASLRLTNALPYFQRTRPNPRDVARMARQGCTYQLNGRHATDTQSGRLRSRRRPLFGW